MKPRRPHEIFAITVLDHHELKGGVPQDLSGMTMKITIWGRVVRETTDYLVVQTVHADYPSDADSVYRTTRPVDAAWFLVKGAIVSKKKVGEWKHPR